MTKIKCNSCGIPKHTVITCGRCGKVVCINCFHFTSGLCPDCMTMFYNEKYVDKINAYAE